MLETITPSVVKDALVARQKCVLQPLEEACRKRSRQGGCTRRVHSAYAPAPVCAAQDAVPHEHGAVFGVIPSVCVQAGEAMQMQYFFAFPTSPQGFAGLPGGSC